MNTDSSSEGPYKHETVMYGTSDCSTQCRACIYAEGRKAIKIKTPCPSCGFTTLDVDSSGNIVCSFLDCKNPTQIAKAEGRKSMEKEFSEKENHEMKEKCSASWNSGFDQCMQLMKRELGWQEAQNEKRENEFNELLELANRLVAPAGPKFQAVTDFKSWKKARGIE